MPLTRTFLNRNRILWFDFFLIILLSAVAFIQIGDFEIRLANPPSGDDPVIYAHFLSNPESFKGDQIYYYGDVQGRSTIINWLPALLYKTLHVPPEIPAWIILYLQNMLLGLATLKYARAVTNREDVAWLTVFFVYAAQPMQWNLVSLTNLMTIPYTTPFATPLYLFAGAAAVKKKVFWTTFWLCLGGLAQPSTTLMLASMFGLYWVMQVDFSRLQETVVRLTALAIVSMVCLWPVLSLKGDVANQLSVSEFMALLPLNGHLSPWVFPPTWSVMLPSFVGFVLLAGLSLRERRHLHPSFFVFWKAAVITFIIASIVYVIGRMGAYVKLLQLSPLRFSIYLVMFSLPMIIAYLVQKTDHPIWIFRWAAITTLLIYGFVGYGCFTGLFLILGLSDFDRKQSNFFSQKVTIGDQQTFLKWVALISVMVWISLVFLSLAAGTYSWDTKQLYQFSWRDFAAGIPLGTPRYLMLCIFLGGALLASAQRLKMSDWFLRRNFVPPSSSPIIRLKESIAFQLVHIISKPTMIITLVLMVITIQRAWQTGQQTRAPLATAMYEAQLWARKNTSEDAKFIHGGSWRTVSLRQQIIPFPRFNYAYSGSKPLKNLDDDISRFYGLAPYQPGEPVWEHINRQVSAYNQIDDAGIVRFARRFGGDYAVRTSDQQLLELPVAYSNNLVQIYKIP